MNFKEQYKATFSEIHPSEDIVERLCEVKNMKGNTVKMTKNKKKFMALIAAAIFAATSAVAVSAGTGALDDTLDNLHMYIDGKEVSASDYIEHDDGAVENQESGGSYEVSVDLPEGSHEVSIDGYAVNVIYDDVETKLPPEDKAK